jgi:aldehyde:ferredoxin oxidoreductase
MGVLAISEGNVEIRSVTPYWGKETFDAELVILQDHNRKANKASVFPDVPLIMRVYELLTQRIM